MRLLKESTLFLQSNSQNAETDRPKKEPMEYKDVEDLTRGFGSLTVENIMGKNDRQLPALLSTVSAEQAARVRWPRCEEEKQKVEEHVKTEISWEQHTAEMDDAHMELSQGKIAITACVFAPELDSRFEALKRRFNGKNKNNIIVQTYSLGICDRYALMLVDFQVRTKKITKAESEKFLVANGTLYINKLEAHETYSTVGNGNWQATTERISAYHGGTFCNDEFIFVDKTDLCAYSFSTNKIYKICNLATMIQVNENQEVPIGGLDCNKWGCVALLSSGRLYTIFLTVDERIHRLILESFAEVNISLHELLPATSVSIDTQKLLVGGSKGAVVFYHWIDNHWQEKGEMNHFNVKETSKNVAIKNFPNESVRFLFCRGWRFAFCSENNTVFYEANTSAKSLHLPSTGQIVSAVLFGDLWLTLQSDCTMYLSAFIGSKPYVHLDMFKPENKDDRLSYGAPRVAARVRSFFVLLGNGKLVRIKIGEGKARV